MKSNSVKDSLHILRKWKARNDEKDAIRNITIQLDFMESHIKTLRERLNNPSIGYFTMATDFATAVSAVPALIARDLLAIKANNNFWK